MRPTALLSLLFLAGCTTANLGPGAESNQTQAVDLALPPAEAYTLAYQTAAVYGWTVTESDAVARVITATAPGNAGRWEDTVRIVVAGSGEGSTVTVRSGLGQGPNRRHVEGYLSRLSPSDQ